MRLGRPSAERGKLMARSRSAALIAVSLAAFSAVVAQPAIGTAGPRTALIDLTRSQLTGEERRSGGSSRPDQRRSDRRNRRSVAEVHLGDVGRVSLIGEHVHVHLIPDG